MDRGLLLSQMEGCAADFLLPAVQFVFSKKKISVNSLLFSLSFSGKDKKSPGRNRGRLPKLTAYEKIDFFNVFCIYKRKLSAISCMPYVKISLMWQFFNIL